MQTAREILADLDGVTAGTLEAAARLPNEQLQMMRLVSAGESVTQQWQWLVSLRQENPRAFMKDLNQAEAEWRQGVGRLERPSGPGVDDGGTEQVLSLIEGILAGRVEAGEE